MRTPDERSSFNCSLTFSWTVKAVTWSKLTPRICQFLKDWRLLHLCHFVFFEIVDIDAVGDVAEDKREAVPVDEDL